MYFEAVFDLLPLCRYTLLKTNLQCTKNNKLAYCPFANTT